MSLIWYAAVAMAAALILLFLFYRPQSPSKSSGNPLSVIPEAVTSPNIVGDKLRVLSAEELIHVLSLSPQLANIRANLGLSDENWHKDALPMLHEYITFVQRLPASESHHHAGDGGLVRHTLDVAALSLMAAAAYSWPPDAETEEIARLGVVWRFGIMVAALLHDIGKTLTGFNVELFEHPNQNHGSRWMPDAGSMALSGRNYYRVSFPDKKAAYTEHTEIAWVFFQTVVPAHVRRWMGDSDPKLILALRQYLTGRTDHSPFGKIVREADMASTARDLKSGTRQRFSTAKRTPLIETVMETLREMLADRGRWFSIATRAGGDLFRQGNTVYMVSKNVPDFIREFLRSNNHPAAPSFPNDNQRIFDTLLEYGAVLPNPQDEHRAVTSVDICFMRQDGEVKAQRFTVLAFKLETLYPDGVYPAEFSGSLKVSVDQSNRPRKTAGEEEIETGAATDDLVDTDTKNTQELIAPEVAAAIPPPPRRRETEAVTEPPSNSEVIPQKTESAVPVSDLVTEAGDIDALLEKHGLLDILDEPATETEVTVDTTTKALQPQAQDAAVSSEPITESSDAARTDDQVTPPAKNKKTGKKTSSNNPAGLNILKEIFADNDAVAKPADAELPQQETADAGLAEIQRQRQAGKAESPRPVAVHHVADTANVDALVAESILTEDLTEDITAEESAQPEIEPVANSEVASGALSDIRQRQQQDGRHFWRWLADGLTDGSIAVNQRGAPVHFVPQGMLLVSPAIFRDYAGGVFNKNDENCPGLRAQRGFVSLKLHQRGKKTALFNVETNKGSNKGVRRRLFCCYLIPESNLRHIVRADGRPPNNTDISIAEYDLLAAGLPSENRQET